MKQILKYNSSWMPAVILSMGLHTALMVMPEGAILPNNHKGGQKKMAEFEVNAVMVDSEEKDRPIFEVNRDAPPAFVPSVVSSKIDLPEPKQEIRAVKIPAQEVAAVEEAKKEEVKPEEVKKQKPESVDLMEAARAVEKIDESLYRIYKEYYESVRQKIAGCVEYPQSARHLGIAGRVYVQFIINPRGDLEFIDVLKPASYDVLNYAAVQSIRKAAPFEHYPEKIPPKNFRFSIPIIYALE